MGRCRVRRRPLPLRTFTEAGGEESSTHRTQKAMPQKTLSSFPSRTVLCMAPEASLCGSTATCTSKPRTFLRTRQAWGRVQESKSSIAPWCLEQNGNRLNPPERRGTTSGLALTALRKTSAHPPSRRKDAGRGVTPRRSVPPRENGTSTPLFRAQAKLAVVCLCIISCILIVETKQWQNISFTLVCVCICHMDANGQKAIQ